jgi:hypothetical protein
MAMEEAKVLGRVWGLGEERERKAFAEGLTRADGDKWNIFWAWRPRTSAAPNPAWRARAVGTESPVRGSMPPPVSLREQGKEEAVDRASCTITDGWQDPTGAASGSAQNSVNLEACLSTVSGSAHSAVLSFARQLTKADSNSWLCQMGLCKRLSKWQQHSLIFQARHGIQLVVAKWQACDRNPLSSLSK